MFQKPNYCCNCGDKVDRIEWHLWNSRRFCELCETEFQFDEWWPRAAMFLILVFGFTGIGFHYVGNEKPKIVETVSPRAVVPEAATKLEKRPADQSEVGSAGFENHEPRGRVIDNEAFAETEASTPSLSNRSKKKTNLAGSKRVGEEVVFCGALTKKGTACTRRVKGGGKCWQHKDAE
jgi:hypothetical protein